MGFGWGDDWLDFDRFMKYDMYLNEGGNNWLTPGFDNTDIW